MKTYQVELQTKEGFTTIEVQANSQKEAWAKAQNEVKGLVIGIEEVN